MDTCTPSISSSIGSVAHRLAYRIPQFSPKVGVVALDYIDSLKTTAPSGCFPYNGVSARFQNGPIEYLAMLPVADRDRLSCC